MPWQRADAVVPLIALSADPRRSMAVAPTQAQASPPPQGQAAGRDDDSQEQFVDVASWLESQAGSPGHQLLIAADSSTPAWVALAARSADPAPLPTPSGLPSSIAQGHERVEFAPPGSEQESPIDPTPAQAGWDFQPFHELLQHATAAPAPAASAARAVAASPRVPVGPLKGDTAPAAASTSPDPARAHRALAPPDGATPTPTPALAPAPTPTPAPAPAPAPAPQAGFTLSPRPIYAVKPLPERELVPPKDLLNDPSPNPHLHAWRRLRRIHRRPATASPTERRAQTFRALDGPRPGPDSTGARTPSGGNPGSPQAATAAEQLRRPWLVDAWPFEEPRLLPPPPLGWGAGSGAGQGAIEDPPAALVPESRRPGPPRVAVLSPKGDAPGICAVLSATFRACRERGNALTEDIVATALSAAGVDALSPELMPLDAAPQTDAAREALHHCDALLITVGPGIDAMYAASLALDHLQRDRPDLAENAVVAIERPAGFADLRGIERHFMRNCRMVVQLPPCSAVWHGYEGRFDELHPSARVAWLELAAAVARGFQSAISPPAPR